MSSATGGGSRPFTVTTTDHGGVALIVTSLLMTWTILCFFIRVFTRVASTNSPHGLDDLLCTAATVTAIVQTIIACVSVGHRFGKAANLVSHSQILTIERDQYVVDLLCLLTLTLAKCSMLAFHARITPRKDQRTVGYALHGVTIALGIASIIIEATRCHAQLPWQNLTRVCSDYVSGWVAIAVMDVVTELILFAMPVWILFDLQMATRTKIIILGAFALRLPVIIASITHVFFLNKWTASVTPLVNAVIPFVCLQVEVHYAVMSTTLPCLGPFMKSLNTRWGAIDAAEASSYAMGSLPGTHTRGTPKGTRNTPLASLNQSMNLRPDPNSYSFRVRSDHERGRPSSGSDNSEQMIIRKTISTSVEHG